MKKNNSKLLKALSGALFLFLNFSLSFAQSDVAGSKDPALFSRMPGFVISQYEENEFAGFEFTGKNRAKIRIEGQKTVISYAWPGAGRKPSSLQVINNYENALKRIGGKTLFKTNDFLTLQITIQGKEIWAQIDSEVDAGWGGYILTIVQKNVMRQDVIANAQAMLEQIRLKGHVKVYGILFDSGKSIIKPQSKPVIAEIAKLLQKVRNLRIHIVGHTDNQGDITTNLKLSEARAQAVKKALVQEYNINANRLNTFGAGFFCPVDTNANEAGRAQNRRVELVAQ